MQYMNTGIKILGVASLAVLFSACGEGNAGEAPHIKMGDPFTIVTETDSQYLAVVVNDVTLANRPATIVKKDSVPEVAKDTVKTAETVSSAPVEEKNTKPVGKGLNVPFPQAKMFIANIQTKTYKEPNLETDFGASYELVGGNLQGNQLTVEGKSIEAVYMRYQTIVVARNKNGVLPLESLKKLTDWKKVPGKNSVYKITGLEENQLEGVNVSNKAIKNAVSRDAKAARLSRSATQQWLNSVSKTNKTSQKPLQVELRSVMWKVTGKDANGRPFQRQLRIDIPVES